MTPTQARARLRRARGPAEQCRAARDYAVALAASLRARGVPCTADELVAIARMLEARDAEVARWN